MKRSKSLSEWKPVLIITASVAAVLIAAGIVIYALLSRAPASSQSAGTEAVTGTSEAGLPEDDHTDAGDVSDEEYRLNVFLTAVVRGNIENSATDLDEDAELVRFAFTYRRYYEPESVLEEKDGDEVICRSLTLEQVNDTLGYFFGITVNPDREDYSILSDDGKDFHCVYNGGSFLNVPPYPAEEFDFPLRFALVDNIDRETCTVHFRLYTMSVDDWFEGDAERHVALVPLQSIFGAEYKNEATKNWTKKIGEGDAVLSSLGENFTLVKMTTTLD